MKAFAQEWAVLCGSPDSILLAARNGPPLQRTVLVSPFTEVVLKKVYNHISGFNRQHTVAQVCKLLFLLTSSGVPLLSGIVMLRSIVRFYPYQCSLDAIARGLERGENLSANLEKFPRLYERKLATLLRVGEETGRLPQMLQKQGEDLTRELEHRLRGLGNVLEPAMILVVGALVAVILISMYLPMFKLGGIMG